MSRVAVLAVLAYASVSSAGPVENAGKKFTKGAIDTAKTEVNSGDVASGAREVSAGVLDSVSQRRAELERDARAISAGVADGFLNELRAGLGSDGSGSLRAAIQATLHDSMGGAIHELHDLVRFDCNGSNVDCTETELRRYTYSLARAAAEGISAGTPKAWTFYAAIGAGFVTGVLLTALTALMIGQRRLRDELAAHRP